MLLICKIVSNTPVFTSNGVSLDKPAIASCGSGITACWIALAAEIADGKKIPVFVVCSHSSLSSLILSSFSMISLHVSSVCVGVFVCVYICACMRACLCVCVLQ